MEGQEQVQEPASTGLAVEAGASEALMASVAAFAKEEQQNQDDMQSIRVTKNPDAPGLEHDKDIPVEEEKSEDTDTGNPEEGSEEQQTDANVESEETNTEEESTSDDSITVNYKDKDRKLSKHDIRAALGRAEASQKKNKSILESDDYKMGKIMAAAKGGDKAAQKKLQTMLMDFTDTKNSDDMADVLDEVADDFTTEESDKAEAEAAIFEEKFEDVKDSVDYDANMSIVTSELKDRIPAKVYDKFWENPGARRTMYDLVAHGRMDEVLDAYDEAIGSLPLNEQISIDSDPDKWGAGFVRTVKRLNASKKASAAPKGEQTPKKSNMSSVSSGTQGRTPAATDGLAPDWDNMSDEQYNKERVKLGLRPI